MLTTTDLTIRPFEVAVLISGPGVRGSRLMSPCVAGCAQVRVPPACVRLAQ